MRTVHICIFLFVISCMGFADAPTWIWGQSIGSAGTEYGLSMVDQNGSVIVCGSFEGSLQCGDFTLNGNDGLTFYVAKFDANEQNSWAINTGGCGDQYLNYLTLDGDGNIYLLGGFENTIVCGETTLSAIGGEDIVVAKIDTDGNWLWAVRAGGWNWDYPQGADVDQNGDVYITGKYEGLATFGQIQIQSFGENDLFVAKISSDGEWIWANGAGGEDDDRGLRIAVDSQNNSFITGHFSNQATFDDITMNSGTANSAFCAQISPDGDFIWVKQLGVIWGEYGVWYPIEVDHTGNPIIAIGFSQTAEIGDITYISAGGLDTCIAKYNTDGDVLWSKQLGGLGDDNLFSIAVDPDDNICSTGYFGFSLILGETELSTNGGSDIILSELSPDGEWLWASSYGNVGDDAGYFLHNYSNDMFYLSGIFTGSITLGEITLPGYGGIDAFIAKGDASTGITDQTSKPNCGLLWNSPNPFNPETTISYSLASSSEVTLSIYNIRGEKVTTLYNGWQNAGEHSQVWNGHDANGRPVASGVYFSRLQSENKTAVRKMLLLK